MSLANGATTLLNWQLWPLVILFDLSLFNDDQTEADVKRRFNSISKNNKAPHKTVIPGAFDSTECFPLLQVIMTNFAAVMSNNKRLNGNTKLDPGCYHIHHNEISVH